MEDVRKGDIGAVPAFLRDGHYVSAAQLGHGVGYVSPHVATPGAPAATADDYLPEELRGRTYYRE